MCLQIIYKFNIYTYMYQDLALKSRQELICHKTQLNQIIYLMCKEDLALNNLQGLICHKIQPNQIILI